MTASAVLEPTPSIKLTRFSGWLLFATGVLHNLIGLAMGWPILVNMHELGWWNAVALSGDQVMTMNAIVWFLITGFSWMLLGYLMQLWIKEGFKLPNGVAYGLFAMGVSVAIVMPASGAWLFLPQAMLIWMENTRS